MASDNIRRIKIDDLRSRAQAGIDPVDEEAPDLTRSRSAEQEVLDMLDEPTSGEVLYHGKVEALRAEVQVGIDQADRGEFVEFTAEDVKAEGRKRLAAQSGRAQIELRSTEPQ